ncbi:MAG: hypothetical protein R6U88_07095 [Candidatus Bipolaricaulota bacterium]
MKASWGATGVVGVLLALSVCGSGAWMYPDGFYAASGSTSSWNWLETCHHYAQFQFQRLPTEQSALLMEVLVSVPASAEVEARPTQAVRIRVRPTGGSWTSRQVLLHLTQDRDSDWIYEGQLVLSRRALQIGTNLDVRLRPASWNQTLGVYEGSVRVLSSVEERADEVRIAEGRDDPVREGGLARTALGAGGPFAPDDGGATGVHAGSLSPTEYTLEDPLAYRVPLSVGQWLRLQVEFTGGSGVLELVCPDGDSVAAVEGTGNLALSYRAHAGGTWSVRLVREEDEEVRYRLRMETEN